MARKNQSMPSDLMKLVLATLKPFEDRVEEVYGVPRENGCMQCTLPLLNAVGREIGSILLKRTRLGRNVVVAVKVGEILYRNLGPHLRRLGMRLLFRWRERHDRP